MTGNFALRHHVRVGDDRRLRAVIDDARRGSRRLAAAPGTELGHAGRTLVASDRRLFLRSARPAPAPAATRRILPRRRSLRHERGTHERGNPQGPGERSIVHFRIIHPTQP